jgi:hypothetical protein
VKRICAGTASSPEVNKRLCARAYMLEFEVTGDPDDNAQ